MAHAYGSTIVRLEDLITRELQLARQLIAQKKQSQALIALKKKKLQEGRADNIDKWLLNVEEMVSIASLHDQMQLEDLAFNDQLQALPCLLFCFEDRA